MRELRPDLLFVVDGDVWRDFCLLRDRWEEPLCNGFGDECIDNVRRAIRAGDPSRAAHWKAVRELAIQYGLSWVSAIEVDGVLIHETGEVEGLRYPLLQNRQRIIIDGQQPLIDLATYA